MTAADTEETLATDKDAEIAKWKAMARKHEKASEEASSKLAKIEQDQLSKEEQLAKDLADARQEVSEARSESLRWKIAARHGITDEDAELFLLGKDEDTLTKQAERLAGKVGDKTKNTNVVPGEGKTPPNPKPDDVQAFTRQLFGTGED